MSSPDTKEHILNVAEQLFAVRGFAGTSLRSVIKEAGVNLAAVHYHFGSKEDLFLAVVKRFTTPVVQEQLKRLEQLEAESGEARPLIEGILEAFFAPCLHQIAALGEQGVVLAHFMGRCQTEPEPVPSLVKEQFAENQQRFIQAISQAVPQVPLAEHSWRFECMVAILVFHLLKIQQVEDISDVEATIHRLVNFLAPSLRSPSCSPA